MVVPEMAEKLGLKATSVVEGGVAGGAKIEVPLSALDTLSIADHSTALDPVAIVDINKDPGPYGDIDGIIGSDFIREYPLAIDYPRARLTFETTSRRFSMCGSMESHRANASWIPAPG